MGVLIKKLWEIYNARSLLERLTAGFSIGVIFGIAAAATCTDEIDFLFAFKNSWMIGCLFVIVIGILEWRDKSRRKNPAWQQKIKKTSALIKKTYPNAPEDVANIVAQHVHEQRMSPLMKGVVIFFAAFFIICFSAVFIMKTMRFIREICEFLSQ
jgi:hypothetical protein